MAGTHLQEVNEGDRLARLRVLTRIFVLVLPYRLRLLWSTLALLLGSAVSLAYPQAARYAVDAGLSRQASERFNQIACAFLALVTLQALVVWVRHYLMAWIGKRVVTDLRTRVYRHLLTLDSAWFHARRSGELVGRLSADVALLEGVVGSELSLAARHCVQLVGGVCLLFAVDYRLASLTLLMVPPVVFGALFFGRAIGHKARLVQDHLAQASGQVQESVAAIETVKAFRREAVEVERYKSGVEWAFSAGVDLARWSASFFASVTWAGYVVVAGLFWLGGHRVIVGAISPGELVAFLLYTFVVAGGLMGLASLWGALQRAGGATLRLYQILETPPGIAEPEQPRPLPDLGGALSFEDVAFSYPGSSGALALDGVSLRVEPGETVALVGPSGSGKTTLTALALRFYDPCRGLVRFEGEDVRSLALADLRSNVGIVSQEPVLFHGSVRDNIAFAHPDADMERVVAAARDAHAHDFISGLPMGYETMVGERGVRLSGGQRQRIAIARALLRDPRLLILDEATSSLDAESEALVQAALARLMYRRTTLVIAHRLSTVVEADRIVVLERGRCTEVGKHRQLMQARGAYSRLVEHQLLGTLAGTEQEALSEGLR